MTIPLSKLRRFALDAQGLLRAEPFGRGKNATLKAIEQLGYVQIDTISVVPRAHHHVLHTRVPNYEPAHLDKLQKEGKVFEYWSHAAAYLPMRDYRYALPMMQAIRTGEYRWIRSRDQKLMAEVLRRVADEGPIRARDFENTSNIRSGWWNWKPAKRALEQLFMQGDLMVVGREGFQKVYDLTERLLPSGTDTSYPTSREMARHLLDNTLRSHGFATQKSITHGRPGAELRAALKEVIACELAEDNLISFKLPSGETVYGDPERLASRAPPAPSTATFLSPFDSAVIQRARSQSVFDYDYQIECYVTESERRFGYFCLPILYRDRLVGRADCKAHRSEGRFEVKALFVEDGQLNRTMNPDFAQAFKDGVRKFAAFSECEEITCTRVTPSGWQPLIAGG